MRIRDCFRERKSRDGGVALSERGEATEDGSSPGSEVENPSGSEDFGVQRSDLRSMNLSEDPNLSRHKRKKKLEKKRSEPVDKRMKNADLARNFLPFLDSFD